MSESKEHPIHPWYGPCDSFGGDHCAECARVVDHWKTVASTIWHAVGEAEGVDFGPWKGMTEDEYNRVCDDLHKTPTAEQKGKLTPDD